jgi:hypothetical protein
MVVRRGPSIAVGCAGRGLRTSPRLGGCRARSSSPGWSRRSGCRSRRGALSPNQSDLTGLRFPYWLKTAFSTAGRGVRLVSDERSRTAATNEPLGATGGPLMAQGPAAGQYGQVQANDTTGQLRFPAGSDAVAQSQVR